MSDPLMPLRFFQYELMLQTHDKKFKNVLWMFSSAAYKKASKILKQFEPSVPNNHHVVQVKNLTYGGNINAAGLLLVSDFDKELEKALKKYSKQDIKIDKQHRHPPPTPINSWPYRESLHRNAPLSLFSHQGEPRLSHSPAPLGQTLQPCSVPVQQS